MKKIIVCLLVICMVFASMPVSFVMAEENGPIKDEAFSLDGVTYEYLREYATDEYILISTSDENSWGYQGEDSYWLWNQENHTLTVRNITAAGIGIWDEEFSSTPEALVLEGNNIIQNDPYYQDGAIYCDGELVITGEGALSITQISTTPEAVYSEPVYASSLTISGAILNILSVGCEGSAIYAGDINIINNAEVNIVMESNYYTCFFNSDNLLIKDSQVNCYLNSFIEESYSDGFEVYNNATIENSIVNMDISNCSSEAYGIYVYEGDLTIHDNSAIILNIDAIYSYALTAPTITIDDCYVKSNGGCVCSYGYAGGYEVSDEYIEYWEITPEIIFTNSVILSDNTYIDWNDQETTYEFDDAATIMCSSEEATDILIVPRTYEDIDGNDWFASATGFVTARGLFKGVNNTDFDPNGKFTRAQMMMLLARMAGADTTPAEGQPWYETARLWAMEAGVSDGTNPNDYITREQLVTMLWNFLGKPDGNGDISQFSDADKIESWAEESISWAVENQIVSGKGDGIFDPDGTATRAESSQLIMNFILNY